MGKYERAPVAERMVKGQPLDDPSAPAEDRQVGQRLHYALSISSLDSMWIRPLVIDIPGEHGCLSMKCSAATQAVQFPRGAGSMSTQKAGSQGCQPSR